MQLHFVNKDGWHISTNWSQYILDTSTAILQSGRSLPRALWLSRRTRVPSNNTGGQDCGLHCSPPPGSDRDVVLHLGSSYVVFIYSQWIKWSTINFILKRNMWKKCVGSGLHCPFSFLLQRLARLPTDMLPPPFLGQCSQWWHRTGEGVRVRGRNVGPHVLAFLSRHLAATARAGTEQTDPGHDFFSAMNKMPVRVMECADTAC